jgi:hypothetical protein
VRKERRVRDKGEDRRENNKKKEKGKEVDNNEEK